MLLRSDGADAQGHEGGPQSRALVLHLQQGEVSMILFSIGFIDLYDDNLCVNLFDFAFDLSVAASSAVFSSGLMRPHRITRPQRRPHQRPPTRIPLPALARDWGG